MVPTLIHKTTATCGAIIHYWSWITASIGKVAAATRTFCLHSLRMAGWPCPWTYTGTDSSEMDNTRKLEKPTTHHVNISSFQWAFLRNKSCGIFLLQELPDSFNFPGSETYLLYFGRSRPLVRQLGCFTVIYVIREAFG